VPTPGGERFWPGDRWTGTRIFEDRTDAGRRLAERLTALKSRDLVVLALPRGGVPVAFEVANALEAPLDVIVVRKLGLPYQPELAMGAISEEGVRILNPEVAQLRDVGEKEIAAVERIERAELERRARAFRHGRPKMSLAGRTALIIDDGIATGSTARAACQAARIQGAARVILAVPVAPPRTPGAFADVADEVFCLETPEPFFAVGQFYRHFDQTSDAEVVSLLRRAARARVEEPDPPPRDDEVVVDDGTIRLFGHLNVPERAQGLVVFVHGSGSSRHSPRNRFVAAGLQRIGLATLLFDLLTTEEESDRNRVFDIALLATRLGAVTGWVGSQPEVEGLGLGYFGASTGAAAALWAAAEPGAAVRAVVSRGGRPDLAGDKLAHVRAPTLLIVGGHDDVVLELNRRAQSELRCENQLVVVPGATHLFEESGALESVTHLAGAWFLRHLPT